MRFFQNAVAKAIHAADLRATIPLLLTLAATPSQSSELPIVPDTKLRISVIQWMPIKGVYEQWSALGGEFVVTQQGALELPLIGAVPVSNFDTAGLGVEIAKRLQAKLGLVDRPATVVNVVEYPPIYVVGDVTTPGEYHFRPGLNALQAMALGGGIFRAAEASPDNDIKLAGELQMAASDIILAKARIARLEAEMSGSTQIAFPALPPNSTDSKVAASVFAQEKVILLARAKELERQTKSLTDLRDLLNAEIEVLQEKIKASDADIDAAAKELANVSTLVEKGIAIASRRTDLEHELAGLRTDRLDQVTAVMRARQGVSEATRNIEGLHDKQQTEVAAELQDQRAKLEQFIIKQETSQKLLLSALIADPAQPARDRAITYTIVRRNDGEPTEIPAEESTSLIPGDVVKVQLAPVPSDEPSPVAASSASISTAAAGLDDLEQ
jgi:protein involved in polysaccharide export with SLBB domain